VLTGFDELTNDSFTREENVSFTVASADVAAGIHAEREELCSTPWWLRQDVSRRRG